jgi:hypothetical protein
VEGPCIILHFRTAAELKAAMQALLQMQPRRMKIRCSKETQETCRKQLLLFGKDVLLAGPKALEEEVEHLDAASFCIPEAEARRVLHGTEVLYSSAADDAPLQEHLASLRQALFARTCLDSRSGAGNPFAGLIAKAEVVLGQTSGLLDGATLQDRRGEEGLAFDDDFHAVIFVLADIKRQTVKPLTNAISDSRRWSAAGSMPMSCGRSRGQQQLPLLLEGLVLLQAAAQRPCQAAGSLSPFPCSM